MKEHPHQTMDPRNYKLGMSRNGEDEDKVIVVQMTDRREHRVMKAGNENTINMHTRRKTESNARTKHILARLERYSDALPEPRRNAKES